MIENALSLGFLNDDVAEPSRERVPSHGYVLGDVGPLFSRAELAFDVPFKADTDHVLGLLRLRPRHLHVLGGSAGPKCEGLAAWNGVAL